MRTDRYVLSVASSFLPLSTVNVDILPCFMPEHRIMHSYYKGLIVCLILRKKKFHHPQTFHLEVQSNSLRIIFDMANVPCLWLQPRS